MLVQLLKLYNVTQEWAGDGSGIIATEDAPVYAAVPTDENGFPAICVDELAKRAGLIVDEDTGDCDVSVQHMHLTQRWTYRNLAQEQAILDAENLLIDLEACFGGRPTDDLPGNIFQVSRLAWTHGAMGKDRHTTTEMTGAWEYEAVLQTIKGYVLQCLDAPDEEERSFIYAPCSR